MEKKKKPVRPILYNMEVGAKTKYPLERLATVKAIVCTFGVEKSRRYSTSIDRKNKTVTVTRLS